MKLNILIVEDNKESLKLLRKILVKDGHTVYGANNKNKALECIKQNYLKLNIIILDLYIPVLRGDAPDEENGFAVLSHVKSVQPQIKVIILTAHEDVTFAVRATQDGAFNYLTKPLKLDTLRACFKKISDSITSDQIKKQDTKVFISYAKEDIKTAKKIYNDLIRAGFSPWIDIENIVGGEYWEMKISQAINDSSFFLALLSTNSVSKIGIVQVELKIAVKVLRKFPTGKKFIIPVRLNECNPVDKILHEFHWIDIFPSYNKGLDKLLKAIADKNT